MAQRDYRGLYQLVENTLQKTVLVGQQYLQNLAGRHTLWATLPPHPFTWNAYKGRAHVYTHIARDITLKVCGGLYADGDLLPSVAAMSAEYNVAPSTTAKALAMLNTAGLLHTVNGKRTVVTQVAAQKAPLSLEDPVIQKGVYPFLCAMQLVTLTCKKLALLGAGRLTPQQLAEMGRVLQLPNNNTLPIVFFVALAQAQPNKTLRTIYASLQELLDWGLFIAFNCRGPARFSILQAQCIQAYAYLQAQNHEAFSNLLQDICLSLFQDMKKALIAYGAEGATILVDPPPEIF